MKTRMDNEPNWQNITDVLQGKVRRLLKNTL
jgi:hypothetical protein